MRLDIKYLTAYLPYNVEFYCSIYVDPTGEGGFYSKAIFELTVENFASWTKSLSDIKLILRPLSDLEKSEFSGILEQISKDLGHSVNYKLINAQNMQYKHAILLIENKFDIFGLIENRLAVNINEKSLLEVTK